MMENEKSKTKSSQALIHQIVMVAVVVGIGVYLHGVITKRSKMKTINN